MPIIYSLVIRVYFSLIVIFSLFNNKAKLWLKGRRGLFNYIQSKIHSKEKIVWFHCASLGEFEQGRPVIEEFKSKFSDYKIILTFFSPSGYELRKNYQIADYIFYLPIDLKKNARKFIELINPQMVFFVKYEFWYYYIKTLHEKNIPLYMISANFRRKQLFFRWYGGWYRGMLKYFTHLFVQEENSKKLLSSIGITNVSICGDTRFDRVYSISKQSKSLALIESFKKRRLTLIAGSTWEKDEKILIKYINSSSNDWQYIIVRHEIQPEHIRKIIKSINKRSLKFSDANKQNIEDARVLIIDSVGLLASIYKDGDVAYIGGGFGKGIHNILEAATFGIPVIFGPKYQKFREAKELIKQKGAFSVSNFSELKSKLDEFVFDKDMLRKSGEISQKYVIFNLGATRKIINGIRIYSVS